jgi:RNA polymerase sigma-70 factor (ECF subfamily)
MPELRSVAVDTASDEELIRRFLRKDEAAARALMQRYNRRLYRVARGVVRDDGEAEDILQEAYLRAFSALSDFRGESSLSTWLTRIVLNEAFQRLRRRTDVPLADTGEDRRDQRGAEVIPLHAFQTIIDPERAMAQQQLCRLVERAIDALPCDFRVILIARVIEGMSVEETAAAFDLQPETVKTRLHRARRLLKEALAEHIGPRFGDLFPFAGQRCDRITNAVIERLNLQKGGNL